MAIQKVVVFKPYAFEVGQKIYIEDGPRAGDWEVVSVTKRKVGLRCPISHREVEWDRFCYLMDERESEEWPHSD